MWNKSVHCISDVIDTPVFPSFLKVLLTLVGYLFVAQTWAQDAGLADDFSQNSFKYVTFNLSDVGTTSIAGEPGAIRMSAQQNGTDQADRWLSTSESSHSIVVTAAFDTGTDLATGSGAVGAFHVSGNLFNDTAANPGSSLNDVGVFVEMQARDDGTIGTFGCVGKNSETGFEPVNAFPDGGSCTFFESIPLNFGVYHTLGYRFDPDSRVLTFLFNGVENTVTLNLSMFETANDVPQVNIFQRNAPGTVVALIRSIATDSGTDDFTDITPIVDRYERFFGLDQVRRDARIDNGRLRLELNSIDDQFENLELRPLGTTNYIEALISIGSESDIASGRATVEVEVNYNDTADGGFDGQTGDVLAEVQLRQHADGTQDARYCLVRSNNADFTDGSGLLNDDDGKFCNSFPVRINLDQTYRISVEIDPASSVVRFRLDGFEAVVPIGTGVFQASQPRTQIRNFVQESASAVIFIDDLRTSADALTSAEQDAGLALPPSFPEPPDPLSLQIDTSISDPFNFRQPLSFIDDFSVPTTLFSYWVSRDEGNAAIRMEDGVLELQANTTTGERNSYTELWINEATDSLKARVSLTSDTAQFAGFETDASIRIRTVFYNDTQDGGFNDREGDVSVSIRLRIAGSGRRTADFRLDRRDADGDTQPLNIVDGDNQGSFDDLIPELDTIYELAIRIDRDLSVLVLSIDDRVREIPIPTPAYIPAAREALVQVSQFRAPGRAVGRIHSIDTDTVSHDFSAGSPILAAYRPLFNARFPGRSVLQENGQVRLETDASVREGQQTNLIGMGSSDFVGATLELSSESILTELGSVRARVGGSMYRELEMSDGSESVVFVTVQLVADGNGQRYAEYCAFRSLTANFSDSIQLVGADSESCPRFAGAVDFDKPYAVSVQLDRDDALLTFTFGDEIATHVVATPIFDNGEPFIGAGARALEGSLAVVYVDDLAFAQEPEPLSASDTVPDDNGDNGAQMPSSPVETPVADANIELFGIVYSSTAIELRWLGLTGIVKVTRNGETVYSGDGRSFFDDALQPGTAYTYTVSNGTGTAAPMLLVTFPNYPVAEKQPLAPADIRSIAYSRSAGELFWDRVNTGPPARWYEISQDGWVVGTLDALSYFTEVLERGSLYTFDVVSIAKDGQRSSRETVSLTTND